EDPASPDRPKLLAETIEAFRKTIAIDSENVDAHYGLGRAYDELARISGKGSAEPASKPDEARDVTPESLVALAEKASGADARTRSADRAVAARGLARDIVRFINSPRPEFGSRLTPLLDVMDRLAGPCASEPDPATRAALAKALAVTHTTLHSLY